MKEHEIIAEIRETRRKISARFEHDPKRMIEYYSRLEKEMGEKYGSSASAPPESNR